MSAQGVCVNDTDGDGNCAACARNPQAPCRVSALECTCGRTACESDLCNCDETPCPVDHAAEEVTL